jgi:nucleoside-diphosphate-sugar epimerase
MEDLVIRERAASPRRDIRRRAPKKVLLTGADGYIGSVLGPLLLARGYDVIGLDVGFYRSGWLYHNGKDSPRLLARDVRTLTAADLEGFDAVVHLAELSNDPLGERDPVMTYAINHRGSVALARHSKAAGVTRFVYASSCSVYGAAEDIKTEESTPLPQTAYAHCKVLVEREVADLADAGFSPTFLRNATAFGASPRMRFDIVLNNLAGLAWTTRRIAMTSDGTPWRPLVHVEDIGAAVVAVLEAPRERIANQILNVGDERNNCRIRDIAAAVAEAFPGCTTEFGASNGDNRSYRVSFEKIRRVLPGFRCRWDVRRGARQLRALFERIAMSDEVFQAAPYTRLKQLEYLVRTNQIDPQFHWQPHDFP